MKRLIPQWAVRLVCAPRGHPQRRYAARKDGVQVIVYTCLCGSKQEAKILPANREIRRAAKHRR